MRMDKVDTTSHDINQLYNLTTSLTTSISCHQLILFIRSVFANLCDSLHYIRMVSTQTMSYIDTATSGTLSPHILPMMDLQNILLHIEASLPSTLHLPVSSNNTLHFYRYLCTCMLLTDKQFLLLINVPIQDRSQHLPLYKAITLNIPHGNFTVCYDITTKYLAITEDETMGVELSSNTFQTCLAANSQSCHIPMPFQPLANLLLCISALYSKNMASISACCSLHIRRTSDVNMLIQVASSVWIITTPPPAPDDTITIICPGIPTRSIKLDKQVHILKTPTACRITSPHFHLPPTYQSSNQEVNISLHTTNLHMVNISLINF